MAGHVSVEPGKDGKLICDEVRDIADVTANLWLQFSNEAKYNEIYPLYENLDKKLKDLLYGLMLRSGNDAAIMIAE